MRDDEAHLLGGQLARPHRLSDQLLEFRDGELVHLAALDLHEMAAFGDHRFADGEAAAGGAFHHVPAGAVGVERVVDQSAARVVAALEDDRAGAVAEQDAAPAVVVVGDPAERLGADDQDVAVLAGLDEVGAGDGGVEKAAARRRQVECRCAGNAQVGADEAGGGGTPWPAGSGGGRTGSH